MDNNNLKILLYLYDSVKNLNKILLLAIKNAPI